MKYLNTYYKFRRKILKLLVPEFVWPTYIFLDGVKIKIKNMPFSFGTKRELINGMYEINERNLLKGRLKEGEVVFEFGSSLGILTSILSSYVGSNGFVISVEASSRLVPIANLFLKNKFNVNVICGFGFPVFSLKNSINITSFDEDGGSLGGRVSYQLENVNNENKKEDNIFDLKKLIEIAKKEPDILVIDIEGSETVFLEQSPEFPKTIRLILIEFHPHIYGVEKMELMINVILNEDFKLLDKNDYVFLFEK